MNLDNRQNGSDTSEMDDDLAFALGLTPSPKPAKPSSGDASSSRRGVSTADGVANTQSKDDVTKVGVGGDTSATGAGGKSMLFAILSLVMGAVFFVISMLSRNLGRGAAGILIQVILCLGSIAAFTLGLIAILKNKKERVKGVFARGLIGMIFSGLGIAVCIARIIIIAEYL